MWQGDILPRNISSTATAEYVRSITVALTRYITTSLAVLTQINDFAKEA